MRRDIELRRRKLHVARRDAIGPAFAAILGVVDDVFPIDQAVVESARRLLEGSPRLSARDAVHVAIMRSRGVLRVMSFDRGFDGLPRVARLAG